MTDSIFMRIEGDGKDFSLAQAVRDISDSKPNPVLHTCATSGLARIPLAPFAYWVDESVRQLFDTLPPFEGEGRTVKQGLATADDFRFVRTAWESPDELPGDPERTWFAFAKGGSYSPFYADIYLRVNWGIGGTELDAFSGSVLRNTNFYFRSGLTWALRTTSGLALRALPSGCVFGHKGPAAFADSDEPEELLAILAISSSQPFHALVALQLAAAEAAARSYEVGVIQRTVVPTKLDPLLAELALAAWTAKRRPDTANLTSHAFLQPALAQSGSSLTEAAGRWSFLLADSANALAAARSEIDDIAYRLYGLGEEDRRTIEKTVGSSESGKKDSTSASGEDEEDEDSPAASASGPALVSELFDYVFGCAFGRWDIRYATGERQPPELPAPFDPLPVCPPGMLQNAGGLPAEPKDLPADCPLRISWPGILVDDAAHPEDIVTRVEDALQVIWKERWEAIEHEACEILGVKSLRDYFRKPTAFFADHLKRYSKSRRQAPIYWPLSTASGSYTLWIYCHRLTPEILFACITNFVAPKQEQIERTLARLGAKNPRTAAEEKEYEAAASLIGELATFRAELERLAKIWKPNLNDGVQITAAPLWSLFRLPKWQKTLKETWQELEKGDYDWAHLALSLWPERVIPKCVIDRSLAIAHGFAEALWEEVSEKKGKRTVTTWKPRKDAGEVVARLIAERTAKD